MKKFLIKGPDTEKEFEIEDDEMINWEVIKIKDYEDSIQACEFCGKKWHGYRSHCPHCGRKPKGLIEVGG